MEFTTNKLQIETVDEIKKKQSMSYFRNKKKSLIKNISLSRSTTSETKDWKGRTR